MVAAKVSTKPMKMPEIRKKAQSLGITTGKMRKAKLIHAIQQAENCTPCFGRSNGQCQYSDCCFMPDCLKISI
ncbi:MAG: SAP domain-containing protein [Planctomycetota bacterium]